MEERCQLLGGKGFHLPVLQLGQGAAIRRFVAIGFWSMAKFTAEEITWLMLRTVLAFSPLLVLGPDPLRPAAVQQLFVGFLQVQRG